MSTTDTPAEFASSEQAEAHIAALEAEAEFCDTSSKAAHLSDAQREARGRRAKEAKAEITRIRKTHKPPAKAAASGDEAGG